MEKKLPSVGRRRADNLNPDQWQAWRERERLDSWLIDGGRREGKRERLDSREERMREKSRMGGRRAEREVSGREKLEK